MTETAKAIDPYRIFFPLGVLFGFAGVAVWPLYLAGWIDYPGASHGPWMIGNFLLAFACGFLLTAVPKFTGTDPCSRTELAFATVLVCGSWYFFWMTPATFALLMIFFGRRFVRRAYSPPPHFVFVGLGLLCGFAGSFGIVLGAHGADWPIRAFRVLFFQGLMLSLLVGVGSRMLRVLLGFERSPLLRIESDVRKPARADWFRTEGAFSVAASFGLFATGFALEFWPGFEGLGRCLRAAVVAWIAFSAWNIHRLPRGKGVLAWGIWASAWSLLIGSIAYPFSGTYAVSVLHLVFIGGFGMTTFLVASRVVLAHGRFRVEVERRSRALALTGALAIVAGAARVGAAFSSSGYLAHLAYASAAWLAAILIWGAWMGKKLRA